VDSIIKSNVSRKLIYSCVALLFIIVFLLSVSVGSVQISILDTLRIIIKKFTALGDTSDLQSNLIVIIDQVHIPRVLLSALVGAALSIAGVAMQGLLRNLLADQLNVGCFIRWRIGCRYHHCLRYPSTAISFACFISNDNLLTL
jgi:iron complex transport system permease protein